MSLRRSCAPKVRRRLLAWVPALLLVAGLAPAVAGPARAAPPAAPTAVGGVDSRAIGDVLSWRNVGPQRGGRSLAVTGSVARPNEYYFGATGGGLWKTTDAGQTWAPVSDKAFTSSSVGAVAVCASNPDVVYAGMGEVDLRGDVIPGDGVYRSGDGGKTWSHVGLVATQTIAKLRIDPKNCDRVYAAALGHPFGANPERGVFRTVDGGKTWAKVLYRDALTGAADVKIDPANPNTLYASLWHAYRKPWLLNSGGAGSGLFKSADGGSTWTELTRNKGLPAAPIGKIGVAVAGARVYALVEAKKGGLYQSKDGGASWTLVNADAALKQRAFYYMHLFVDPKNPSTIWVLNVDFLKSVDGGKTFAPIDNPHGDNHDLWFDPTNPQRMIEGSDGGATVSTNGGGSWTTADYSTAQFYHVATTNDTPYQICGAQQDNSTVCVPSTGTSPNVVGSGESGWVAVDPRNSNVIYSGSYGGYLSRLDRRTGQARNVNPWPDNPMGHPARDLKERFQWTFPIVTSTADPTAVYAGSQHVFRSTNGGQSWQRISPDLTRDDPATQGDSGGPITKDQSSIEYFNTVFTIAPSPRTKNVIWAGSDDGLVHVTRDLGKSWTDVSPALLRNTRITVLDASTHSSGTAYAAAQNYRQDDNTPYLFKTHDYGKTWTPITNGIAAGDFAWSIREDPHRAGLLYAGTEHGVYVSFDDGAHWQSLRLNVPDTSVQDLTVKGNDLIIATHGRGFYVLSGLSLLRQLQGTSSTQARQILARYRPATSPAASRAGGPTGRSPAAPPTTTPLVRSAVPGAGGATLYRPADPVRSVNRSVTVYYELKAPATHVSMSFLDAHGRVIRTLTGLPAGPGLHTGLWDLRYPGPVSFPGIVFWAANPTRGAKAPLGTYSVRLSVDQSKLVAPFHILKDPALTGISAADIQAEYALATKIVNRTSDANTAVIDVKECVPQVQDRVKRAGDADITSAGSALIRTLSTVEQAIYQDKSMSGEDPLNYPIRLNNKIDALLGVVESADNRPTDQSYKVYRLLSGQLQTQLNALRRAVRADVPEFNHLVLAAGLPPVMCRAS